MESQARILRWGSNISSRKSAKHKLKRREAFIGYCENFDVLFSAKSRAYRKALSGIEVHLKLQQDTQTVFVGKFLKQAIGKFLKQEEKRPGFSKRR